MLTLASARTLGSLGWLADQDKEHPAAVVGRGMRNRANVPVFAVESRAVIHRTGQVEHSVMPSKAQTTQESRSRRLPLEPRRIRGHPGSAGKCLNTLSHVLTQWDHPNMSENHAEEAVRSVPHEGIHDVPQGSDDWGTPITRQLRTVGRRRRDAELKLEQHLQEARRKNKPHDGPAEPIPSG